MSWLTSWFFKKISKPTRRPCAQALAIQQETLGNHPDTLSTLVDLAIITSLQDFGAGQEVWRAARTLHQQVPQQDDHTELEMWNGLAYSVFQAAKWDESEEYSRRALAVCHRDPDCDDSHTRYLLSRLYVHQGRPREAEETILPALETSRELYGESSWPFGMCLMGLAEVRLMQGALEAAETVHQDSLALANRHFPEGHNIFGFLYGQAARLRERQEDLTGAVAISQRAVEILEATLRGPNLTREVIHLADLLRRIGKVEEAALKLEYAFELLREKNAEGSWHYVTTQSVQGGILSAQGRREEAEPLLLQGFRDVRQVAGDRSAWTLKAHARLVEHYVSGGEDDRADEVRAWLPAEKMREGGKP